MCDEALHGDCAFEPALEFVPALIGETRPIIPAIIEILLSREKENVRRLVS